MCDMYDTLTELLAYNFELLCQICWLDEFYVIDYVCGTFGNLNGMSSEVKTVKENSMCPVI